MYGSVGSAGLEKSLRYDRSLGPGTDGKDTEREG